MRDKEPEVDGEPLDKCELDLAEYCRAGLVGIWAGMAERQRRRGAPSSFSEGRLRMYRDSPMAALLDGSAAPDPATTQHILADAVRCLRRGDWERLAGNVRYCEEGLWPCVTT